MTTNLTTLTKDELEAEKIRREIRNLDVEHRKTLAEAEAKELTVEEARKNVAQMNARPTEHNVYTLYGTVDAMSCGRAIETLHTWSNEDPDADLTLVFNSPGGSVIDGLALFDAIRGLSAKGHHVTTIGSGMAASMGGVLLQAGDTRRMEPNSFMLIHEVSTGAMGKMSAIQDRLDFSERLQGRLLDILAERTVFTPEEVRERWERKDWWLGAEEALELGFVDEVGGVA